MRQNGLAGYAELIRTATREWKGHQPHANRATTWPADARGVQGRTSGASDGLRVSSSDIGRSRVDEFAQTTPTPCWSAQIGRFNASGARSSAGADVFRGLPRDLAFVFNFISRNFRLLLVKTANAPRGAISSGRMVAQPATPGHRLFAQAQHVGVCAALRGERRLRARLTLRSRVGERVGEHVGERVGVHHALVAKRLA